MRRKIVVAVTGASGAAYAVRLVEVLAAAGCEVYLTISANAEPVFREELSLPIEVDNFSLALLDLDCGPRFRDAKLQRVRMLAGPDGEEDPVVRTPDARSTTAITAISPPRSPAGRSSPMGWRSAPVQAAP